MRRTPTLVAAAVLLAVIVSGTDAAGRRPVAASTSEPVALEPACADAPSAGFDDIDGVHRAGIDCIAWWGLTEGVNGGGYDPDGQVTRGQIATFIAALLDAGGTQLPAAPADAFNDDDGTVHETAIDQLAELEVVRGIDDDRYAAGRSVTRGQLATFLAVAWQALVGEPLPIEAAVFTDIDGSIHQDSIDRVAAAGLTVGTTASTYTPDDDVTRAQMATFLARLLAKLIADDHVTYPPSQAHQVPDPAGCAAEGADVTISGTQSAHWRDRDLAADATIDATGARWAGVGEDPIRVGGGSGICWHGGEIDGEYGEDFTWDDAHDTAAFSIYGPDLTVTGLRIHNEGDLINLKDEAANFTLSGLHLSHGRDDCIENDYVHSGILEDSLLDGCYTALSARPSSDRDDTAADNEWVVRRSLLRLEPMEQVYKGDAPGHGRFFKWGEEDRGVGISLHDNVFMAEQPPNGGDLSLPEEHLRSCSGNVMVWLGEGEFPGWLPESCFTVTTDRQVWDDAVAEWKDAHLDG